LSERRKRLTGSLRPMGSQDLELVLGWRNHPEVRRWMYTTHEIGLDEHRTWFAGASEDPRKHLLVYEVEGVPAGFVNLTVDVPDSNGPTVAVWGFYLAPDAPRGCGRGLGSAAIAHAFRELGVDLLLAEALGTNANSIAFHRRLGFADAGPRDEPHRPEDGGEVVDVLCFRLERAAWAAEQEGATR